MGRVLDNSYNPVVDNDGNEITSHGNANTSIDSDLETYLSNTHINSNKTIRQVQWLKARIDRSEYLDWSKFDKIWLMVNNRPASTLVELKGGASLTSSGDHTTSDLGINGGDSYYFDTAYNPSTRITDIDNFSIGLIVSDDTDEGTDLGADDSINYCTIQTRSTGTCSMTVGDGSAVTFANTESNGIYTMNVRGGTLYAYKDYEEGSNGAVTGSLPSQNIYLCATNGNGTATDYTGKTIGGVWIYDGQLSEEGVLQMNFFMEEFYTAIYRDYGQLT